MNDVVRNLMEGDSGAHQAFGTLVTQEFSLPLQGSIREKQQLVLYREQEGVAELEEPFHLDSVCSKLRLQRVPSRPKALV